MIRLFCTIGWALWLGAALSLLGVQYYQWQFYAVVVPVAFLIELHKWGCRK